MIKTFYLTLKISGILAHGRVFLFKFYIPRCKCSDLILPYIDAFYLLKIHRSVDKSLLRCTFVSNFSIKLSFCCNISEHVVSIPSAVLVVLPLTAAARSAYASLRQGVWHIFLLRHATGYTIRQISSPGRNFSRFLLCILTASSRAIVRPCSIIRAANWHLPLVIMRQHHVPPIFFAIPVAPDISDDKSWQHEKNHHEIWFTVLSPSRLMRSPGHDEYLTVTVIWTNAAIASTILNPQRIASHAPLRSPAFSRL